MTTQQNDLLHIREYLFSHKQMSAATSGDFPWIFTAYYVVDQDLNLYFLTGPSTIHGLHLAKNPQIAVAIADSPQDLAGKKAGLQMSGLCTLLTEDSEVKAAIDLWRTTLKVDSTDYTLEGIKSGKISGRMYKIVPKKLKFFNEALQEEGKEKFIEL